MLVEPVVEPVAPVVPEFGLVEGVVLGVVLLVVPGVVLALPLTEPVPVAPIEDVEPGVALLVVVSVLVELLVDVLGVVLPELVVVDGGVVVVLLLVEPVAPVPLEPVVESGRLQALRDRAAAIAIATAVNWVFIRNSLIGVLRKWDGQSRLPWGRL